MRGLFLGLLAAAAAAVIILAAGWWRISAVTATSSAKRLSDQCAASVGSDGYGIVEVNQDLILANDDGQISVNCTLHLHNGSRLTLSNLHLKTRNLIVSDDKPDSQGSRVTIEDSSLFGVGVSALIVDLRHRHDTITVHHSIIDYGLGIRMGALGLGPAPDLGGGTIEVTDSTMRSTDGATSGIIVAASSSGGVGRFVNDVFRTSASASGGLAILYAGSCHEENVTGAPPFCQGH
jgi:hypothetical protein